MKNIIKGINKFPKAFVKPVVIILIIASIFKIASIGFSYTNKHDRDTSIFVIEGIARKIKNMEYIDNNAKAEIDQMVNDFNKRSSNGLYHIHILKFRQSSYIHYKYDTNEPENFLSREYDGENGWYISYKISEAQANIDDQKEQERQSSIANVLLDKTGNISSYLFIFSAILQCLYFISKAFRKNTNISG